MCLIFLITIFLRHLITLAGLKKYVKLCTGSDSLSPVSTHHIHVLVSEDTSDGIFGSTCLLRLNLTKDMGTMKFATFKAALEATFSSGRKAFTSVQSLVRVTCDKSN